MCLAVCPAVSASAASPATGYRLLPAASSLTFSFTQAGAVNRGRFRSFSVSFDPATGRLTAVIDMRSTDTGDAQRNGILAGKEFFAVTRYPQARFTADRLTKTAAGFQAIGTLTIRGVTRTVVVPFTWRVGQAGGRQVGMLAGEMTIRRLDFGVGRGQWRSTEWVGNTVTVHYALELTPVG